jgi:hypothetical protein
MRNYQLTEYASWQTADISTEFEGGCFMKIAQVTNFERCWTVHQEGRVALVLKLDGKALAIPLDPGTIAELREQLAQAEVVLTNYNNVRGR